MLPVSNINLSSEQKHQIITTSSTYLWLKTQLLQKLHSKCRIEIYDECCSHMSSFLLHENRALSKFHSFSSVFTILLFSSNKKVISLRMLGFSLHKYLSHFEYETVLDI